MYRTGEENITEEDSPAPENPRVPPLLRAAHISLLALRHAGLGNDSDLMKGNSLLLKGIKASWEVSTEF